MTPRFTLRRRLAWQLSLLLACLLTTAGVGLWQVVGLRQDFSLALDRYEKLRELYGVGFHLQAARLALSLDFPDVVRARLEARRAQDAFRRQADELGTSAQVSAVSGGLATVVREMERPRPSAVTLDAPYAALQTLVDGFRSDISAAQATADRRQRATVFWLAVVATAATLVSALIAVRQYRAIMRPLSALATGVRRVAAGQFKPALQADDADAEFRALAADFNTMAGRLETTLAEMQQRVESATRNAVQSERLAGVGLLAAGVAHEVNNPLSIITGRLELLASRTTDEATRQQLNELVEEGFRCKAIIDRLLELSRGPSGERAPVRIDRLVAAAVESIRQLPAAAGRAIDFSGDELSIVADAGELRQVVVNLLINALRFTSGGRRIDVAVRRAGPRAEVEVRDTGIGLTDDERRRLFEPFFSTRRGGQGADHRGTGLGLAISRAIVEAHGGQIDAFSDGPGRGSRFVVSLPLAEDEAA